MKEIVSTHKKCVVDPAPDLGNCERVRRPGRGRSERCCCPEDSMKDTECSSSPAINDQITKVIEKMMSTIEALLKKIAELGDTNAPEATSPKPTEDDAVSTTPPEVDPPSTPSTPDEPKSSLDKFEFQDFVGVLLGKTKGQRVNEEELYHATIAFLLEKNHGTEAKESYLEAFETGKKKGKDHVEISARDALKSLVASGVISNSEAEEINGSAFRSAQLDNKMNKLGDSNGKDAAHTGFKRAANRAFEQLLLMFDLGFNKPTRELE